MPFPYERYERLSEPLNIYYPAGAQTEAREVSQTASKANALLAELLNSSIPMLEILLIAPADWDHIPPEASGEEEESGELPRLLPYWTGSTTPSSLVIPSELDPIVGEPTHRKRTFLLYRELTRAFLENDPRPWPDEYPLWADEWQLPFAALWLSQQIDGQQGIINTDLRTRYAEIFVPEEDGKTPVTVRGFDWYEDTSPEDYLCFDLLLEQFAADLLVRSGPELLPRFLSLYRRDYPLLLSDDVTEMLGSLLGASGIDWLEELTYF